MRKLMQGASALWLFLIPLTNIAGATDANIIQVVPMQLSPTDGIHSGYSIWTISCNRESLTCKFGKILFKCGHPYEKHPSIDVLDLVHSQGTGYNQLWVESWNKTTLKTKEKDGDSVEHCTFQIKRLDELHEQISDAVCKSGGTTMKMLTDDFDLSQQCKNLVIPGKKSILPGTATP